MDELTKEQVAAINLTPDAQILLCTLALGQLSTEQIWGAFLPAIVTQLVLAEPDMPEARRKLCKLFSDEARRRSRNALAELEKYGMVGKVWEPAGDIDETDQQQSEESGEG